MLRLQTRPRRSKTSLQYADLRKNGGLQERSSLLKTARPFRDVPQCRGRGAVVFGREKSPQQVTGVACNFVDVPASHIG